MSKKLNIFIITCSLMTMIGDSLHLLSRFLSNKVSQDFLLFLVDIQVSELKFVLNFTDALNVF